MNKSVFLYNSFGKFLSLFLKTIQMNFLDEYPEEYLQEFMKELLKKKPQVYLGEIPDRKIPCRIFWKKKNKNENPERVFGVIFEGVRSIVPWRNSWRKHWRNSWRRLWSNFWKNSWRKSCGNIWRNSWEKPWQIFWPKTCRITAAILAK